MGPDVRGHPKKKLPPPPLPLPLSTEVTLPKVESTEATPSMVAMVATPSPIIPLSNTLNLPSKRSPCLHLWSSILSRKCLCSQSAKTILDLLYHADWLKP